MSRSLIVRILFNTLGTTSLGLGLVGVIVPLLPTTPFLLLALACYMRGSDRMANWLLGNRFFGQFLQDIQTGRGIPVRTKVRAIVVLWLSLAVSAWFMPLAWVRPLLLIPGLGVTIYLWRYKTRLPDPGKPARTRKTIAR